MELPLHCYCIKSVLLTGSILTFSVNKIMVYNSFMGVCTSRLQTSTANGQALSPIIKVWQSGRSSADSQILEV